MLQRNSLAAHEFMLPPLQTVSYGFDWRKWLVDETILSSEFEANGGLQVYGANILDGNQTSVYVSGGIPGKFYTLTNSIETETRSDSIYITLSCHFAGVVPQMSIVMI